MFYHAYQLSSYIYYHQYQHGGRRVLTYTSHPRKKKQAQQMGYIDDGIANPSMLWNFRNTCTIIYYQSYQHATVFTIIKTSALEKKRVLTNPIHKNRRRRNRWYTSMMALLTATRCASESVLNTFTIIETIALGNRRVSINPLDAGWCNTGTIINTNLRSTFTIINTSTVGERPASSDTYCPCEQEEAHQMGYIDDDGELVIVDPSTLGEKPVLIPTR